MAVYPVDAPTLSYGSKVEAQFRVLSADFGDGYSQRTVDGLNSKSEEWQMVWNTLTNDQAAILKNFFDYCQGAESFDFTAPGDTVSKKWVCKTYSPTPINAAYQNITAKFERVFDF